MKYYEWLGALFYAMKVELSNQKPFNELMRLIKGNAYFGGGNGKHPMPFEDAYSRHPIMDLIVNNCSSIIIKENGYLRVLIEPDSLYRNLDDNTCEFIVYGYTANNPYPQMLEVIPSYIKSIDGCKVEMAMGDRSVKEGVSFQ